MHTLPDIVGDNGVHVIASLSASVIQVVVTGSGTVRIGDSTISSTQGLPIGAGLFTIPYRGRTKYIAASSVYVYIPTGTTVSPCFYE